jgi:hypothetical protein
MTQRIRGVLGSNTIIKGTELQDPQSIPAASSSRTDYTVLIAGSTNGRAVYTFVNIGKNFQKFLYLPGTHMRYQPSCGLNTAGTIYVAYIDNPEAMKDFYAASAVDRLAITKGQANMVSYPLWQEFTYHMKSAPRARMFSTDVTTDFTNADTLNRVCQGMFIYCIDGVVAPTVETTYGQIALQVNLKLEELSATPVT